MGCERRLAHAIAAGCSGRGNCTSVADAGTADFLIGGQYFEPTGRISKARLNTLIEALKTLGDLPRDFAVERVFLPGVTQAAD